MNLLDQWWQPAGEHFASLVEEHDYLVGCCPDAHRQRSRNLCTPAGIEDDECQVPRITAQCCHGVGRPSICQDHLVRVRGSVDGDGAQKAQRVFRVVQARDDDSDRF